MPEEEENQNQIERREPGGGVGRRSDVARRGMNAANYVLGLATKSETELEVAGTTARYSFEFLRKCGRKGTGEGLFISPSGLAIDGDGNVYVVDTDNYRIQVFDPQGRFLCKWGTDGTGDGQFAFPFGLAIDGDGEAYVSDTLNHRIQVFERALLKN